MSNLSNKDGYVNIYDANTRINPCPKLPPKIQMGNAGVSTQINQSSRGFINESPIKPSISHNNSYPTPYATSSLQRPSHASSSTTGRSLSASRVNGNPQANDIQPRIQKNHIG